MASHVMKRCNGMKNNIVHGNVHIIYIHFCFHSWPHALEGSWNIYAECFRIGAEHPPHFQLDPWEFSATQHCRRQGFQTSGISPCKCIGWFLCFCVFLLFDNWSGLPSTKANDKVLSGTWYQCHVNALFLVHADFCVSKLYRLPK